MADGFPQYVEALAVLSSIDERRREALRKAVESAAAEEGQAKTRASDQQRMYTRTARDIGETQKALADMESLLGGLAAPPTPPHRQETEAVVPLATIRSTVAEVTAWTADTRPVLDSLLRSRDRLAQAPRPPAPQPAAPPEQKSRPTWPGWVWGGLSAITVVIIVVITVSTQ